jgi:serine/threonine protein kinase/Flp pilus assembly protein TadD
MASRESEAERIFLEAVEHHAPNQWAEYVQQAAAGDPALAERVEALLRGHGQANPMLEEGRLLEGSPLVMPGPTPGTTVGPYKLLEQIGEGGMGTVYMAEQTQPVQRKVALKVIKPGMDSRQVIARFEAERQALAMMDHVNIARVFDGGTTSGEPGGVSSGRPYFVMELVHGVPITKYCDDNCLTPRERLELFVPVCQAIQHAHQKGIIHRDIKPSNVMITLYDGKPVPKVIDFGVAKATEQKLTERTLFTQYGTMVGTFEYMSPEQAEMSGLGVDTRSDIYSLGVLLYELLTGSTPLTHKRVKEAAYAEILRLIREDDPPKPSTRLSDSGETLASISAQRHMEPAKLTKLVRGELDWIVMKSLEKDRNRRYESASAFAADVQRYLNDEPVQAFPPSAAYRFRKFARRNKSVLGVTALVLFFLVLIGSGVGWVLRDRAAQDAKLAGDRAARRARLNLEVEHALDDVGRAREKVLALTDNPLRWKAALAQAASDLKRAQGLAAQDDAALDPAVRERLQTVRTMLDSDDTDRRFVARFDEIRLEQTAIHPERSEYKLEIAYPALKEALGTYYGIDVGATSAEQVRAVIRRRPSAMQEQILAALDYSLAHAPNGEHKARQWLIAVLETADPHPWRKQARQALAAQEWPTLEKLLQDPAAARQPLTLQLRLTVALPRESPTCLMLSRQIQHSHPDDFWANHNLAGILHYRQRPQWDEAIRYYTAALAVRPRHPATCVNLGNALWGKGDLAGAIAAYRDAVQAQPDYVAAYERLRQVLEQKGDLDGVIAEVRETIRLRNHVVDHVVLGQLLQRKGLLDEAIACYQKAIEVDPKCAYARNALDNAKARRAIAEATKAIELKPKDWSSWNQRAWAYFQQQRWDEAVADYSKAIELNPNVHTTWFHRGHAHMALKKWDEVVVDYSELLNRFPGDANAHHYRGWAHENRGRWGQAIADYSKAIELAPKNDTAHNSLAWLLATCPEAKFRNPKRALELAKKALQLAPQDGESWKSLGAAQYCLGDWKAAIAAFEKANTFFMGGGSNEWFFLAMARWQLGEKDLARQAYGRAVEWMEKYHPKNEELRRLRAEAAELLGIEKKKD